MEEIIFIYLIGAVGVYKLFEKKDYEIAIFTGIFFFVTLFIRERPFMPGRAARLLRRAHLLKRQVQRHLPAHSILPFLLSNSRHFLQRLCLGLRRHFPIRLHHNRPALGPDQLRGLNLRDPNFSRHHFNLRFSD